MKISTSSRRLDPAKSKFVSVNIILCLGLRLVYRNSILVLILLAFVSYGSTLSAACGVSFLPAGETPFSNIRDDGTYQYRLNLGKLQVGNEELPLYAFFESKPSEQSTSQFGPGWRIGLIDHHAYINNTNELVWSGPGGDVITFTRSSNADEGRFEIWEGHSWDARTDGQRIEISSTCGWRFHYNNGLPVIIRMPEGEQLVFHYDGHGRIAKLSGGGFDYLRFSYATDPRRASVMENRFAGEEVEFWLKKDDEPLYRKNRFVRRISVDRVSIIRIGSEPGSEMSFAYAHDTGEKTSELVIRSNPQINARPIFARWETSSGRVLETNRWKVAENRASADEKYVKLVVLENGDQENIWERDLRSGRTFVKLSGRPGVETVEILGRGPAAGQIRSERLHFEDGTKRLRSFTYDTQGRKIRVSENGRLFRTYRYDDHERYSELTNGEGVLLWRRLYDDQGRVSRILYSDKSQLEFMWGKQPSVKLTQGNRHVSMKISELPETLRNQIIQ